MTHQHPDVLKPIIDFLIEYYGDNINSAAPEIIRDKELYFKITNFPEQKLMQVNWYWTESIDQNGKEHRESDYFKLLYSENHLKLESYVNDVLDQVCSTEFVNEFHHNQNNTYTGR